MPAPTVDPNDLDPAEVVPADSYRPADPVWVYRSGAWHAGVIVAASTRAATVTYRPGHGPGTAVDTLTAAYLAPRADIDPLLDGEDGELPGWMTTAGHAVLPGRNGPPGGGRFGPPRWDRTAGP